MTGAPLQLKIFILSLTTAALQSKVLISVVFPVLSENGFIPVKGLHINDLPILHNNSISTVEELHITGLPVLGENSIVEVKGLHINGISCPW